MKKILLSFIAVGVFAAANAQVVYKDDFSNGTNGSAAPYWGTGAAEVTTVKNSAGDVTVTRSTGSNDYVSISYNFYNNPVQCTGACASGPSSGTQIASINMSGGASQDTIFIIAKTSISAGAVLRLDIKDAAAHVSDGTPITRTLTSSYATYKFPFSGTVTSSAGTVNKAAVEELGFYLEPGTTYGAGVSHSFTIDYLQIGGTSATLPGGSGTTAVASAQANISTSKLYPNPTSDMANISLELKSTSDVKVTLTDLMGKEVMTIANGTMASLNESFSVANLHKGIYTVNYFINGSAAKADMLMVK